MPFLPKQAADSSIRRAERFLSLADNALPIDKVKNDLRRMALVMAVAAIDSYMHALVSRRIADIRRSADLPKKLSGLDISFSDLANLADSAIAAQRAEKRSRPWVQVKSSLQRRLLKETFQSYDQVAMALSMAGIKEPWKKICAELKEANSDTKKWLDTLVHRRNQIVHEGDLKRASRPRKLSFNAISQAEARSQVRRVEVFIGAVETVVNNNP